MPVHYLAQCAFTADTALPADKLVINPTFRDKGITSDPNNLAQELAVALSGWMSGGGRETTVKLYDLEGTKPIYPAGQFTQNKGVVVPSGGPRELSVCLSFFAQHNRPSQRGRLYIPMTLIPGQGATAWQSPRVLSITRDAVGELPDILAGIGGADVDWIVWSRKQKLAHQVTDWFVDDEWDVIRSRGFTPAQRTTGTTSG